MMEFFTIDRGWDILQIIFADIILSGDNALVIELPGILFLGGLLLTWVCWRFWEDLCEHVANTTLATAGGPPHDEIKEGKTLFGALVTITIADVSMSIANVLAVAAIAREDTSILIFGLALAIIFMTLCATMIMRLLTHYPLLSYIGLIFLVYLSAHMLWDGWPGFASFIGIGGSA